MPSSEEWLKPLFYVFDPSKRLFFVYLLTSFALAFLILSVQKRKLSLSTFTDIFNPKLWLHRSSHVDLQLLFFNSILKTTLFLFVTITSIGLAKQVASFLYHFSPWDFTVRLEASTVFVLYGLSSFMVLDFSRFFQHYLLHKVSWLWEFHKIHHSAEVLTPLTLYRTHPVESILSSLRRILVIGLVSGFFIYMTQSAIGGLAILGVNAFDFVFNVLGSNLRHSHVWMRFGPLEHILMSPAQHQIHHSRAQKHFDKNFGVALSLWDKLFGTFEKSPLRKPFLIFGIHGEYYKNAWEAYRAPQLKKQMKID